MKGFEYQSELNTQKNLTNILLLKSLPYGRWITKNHEEYLFNRDYEPILGWDLKLNAPIRTTPNMWIYEIIEEETKLYYGNGIDYPIHDIKTLRKCWDILADWSKRTNTSKSLKALET